MREKVRNGQLVNLEEPEPAEAQIVYLGKEAGERDNVKIIADKVRLWRGKVLHVLAVENQTYVDYGMVLRNMLTESLSYRKQWKQKKTTHGRKGDLGKGSDAFLSGITREEKFIPIITLVVYCGTEHPWDGARCLYDLLDIEDEMRAYITNYRLNLYDCYEHDTFEEYHTGLRQLFEVIRYKGEKEKLKEVIEQSREAYSSMDGDTKELIEVVAGIKIPEKYRVVEEGESGMEKKFGRYNVCKALEDYRLEGEEEGRAKGKEEGMRQHLVQLVCKKLQKNKAAATIAEELEEELPEIEKVIEAQKKVGNYDVGQICKAMGF